MKLPFKGKLLAILTIAFICYFVSESMLRQGAVSSIDSGKISIDSLISELPGAIKDEVSYRIHYMQLQESIRTAKTPAEKASSLCSMAMFTKEDEQRLTLFEEVYKRFPDIAESLQAYLFFLQNESAKTKISIGEFQDYLKKLSVYDQFYALSSAYAKLREANVSDRIRFQLLAPLLKKPPQYRDYASMYRLLADLCSRMGREKEYKQALEFEEMCLDKPMMETMYAEMLEKQHQQNQKKEKPEKK